MEDRFKGLTIFQKSQVAEIASSIIEELPDKALNELLSSYSGDVQSLVFDIFNQTERVVNLGGEIESSKIGYLDALKESMDDTLKRLSYNYFKTTVLSNFRQGWRNLEWGNIIQLYPNTALLASRASGKSYETCYAFPLWRIFSYQRPSYQQRQSVDNQNRKETCIITNTATLGKQHISKINEEIQLNDILTARLNPNGRASLAELSIEVESGAKIHMRGKDGFIRGLHVGACICDDLPDESSIYSSEQRDKLWQLFVGAISPIVEPYGYHIVSGTPYHQQDMYYEIRKSGKFKLFEYPAIFPDGKLLAPDRFTFDKLEQERETLGSLVFSREYLVVPLSDNASIFPYEFLMRATTGMENRQLVDNIYSFPIKMKRVTVGCDFAISGTVSADYTVYSVWGRGVDDLYYLLYLWRKQGASHNEQVNKILEIDSKFHPNCIKIESNGFQRILGSLAKERGLKNIEEFTTTSSSKKDLYSGLPSLGAMFERGEIKLPYKEGETKNTVNLLMSEFNSIAFRGDKGTLESISGHDDMVMSSFIALTDLRERKQVQVKVDLI